MNTFKFKTFDTLLLVGLLGLGLTPIQSSTLPGAWVSPRVGSSELAYRKRELPSERITVRAAGRGNPWINLRDGVDLKPEFSGPAALQEILKGDLAKPRGLACGDFDEDGVPDLVSGYAGPTGGLITLHRGNVDSIFAHSPEAQQRKAQGTFTDAPFLSPARVFGLPESPDFLGAGDFDNDGHWDVVATTLGGSALYLLPGDGKAGFGAAEQIKLPGAVTALVTGEINRADGLTDVIVGIAGPDGARVLIFEGPEGALGNDARGTMNDEQKISSLPVHHSSLKIHRSPEAFPLPAAATSLALGQLEDGYEMDLAVTAGTELIILHGRDRRLSLDELRQAEVQPAILGRQRFSFQINSMALGDFVRDDQHRTEIALLGGDGAVHLLGRAAEDRGSKTEESQWGELLVLSDVFGSHLVRAKVSSLPTDDLVLMDPSKHQLRVLTQDRDTQKQSSILNPRSAILEVQGIPVAILPMRLNADALNDLVVLEEGSGTPAVAMTTAAMTFTVTNTGDNGGVDPAPGAGTGTLRQAVVDANANMGADMISFSIGSGVQTIALPLNLPTITDPVTIDGTTQPGFVGSPIIELNGTGAGGVPLVIVAGTSTVRGLVINRFAENGITLAASGSNLIEGNFIGTDVTGTVDLGNGVRGVLINNIPSNTIGGTTAAARNVISGNNQSGVEISSSGAAMNQVQGNFIGTDVSGTVDLGNSIAGVLINDAPTNTIGGTTAAARNVISGNDQFGVNILDQGAAGNQVQGNFIGTDVNGTADLGNSDHGVIISAGASANTIGGTAQGARNVISGNNFSGVLIANSGTTGNVVQGNHIGTDLNGTAPLGNSTAGVFVTGGPSNTAIGGTASGAGNTIAFNGVYGVLITSTTSGNGIRHNSIFSNGGLGIDLDIDGVTINDPMDPDPGPNLLQNYPVLASATSGGGTTTINGSLNSTPNTLFHLDFFANTACDPSGQGEGETFLGTGIVGPTDAFGNVVFTVTLPVSVAVGQQITATATNANTNDTSEFSNCLGVSGPSCTINCPANITQSTDPGQCTAVVTYAPTTTGTGCGAVSCNPPSGSTFQTGSTLVTCSAGAGPSCTFIVTVNDTQPPTITCPANVTKSTDSGQCTAVVTYPAPTVNDNCPGVGAPVCNPLSGSTFPQGTTTVTCTVSDASGNPATCSFTVTVNDTQNPAISCPSNITTTAAAGQCSAVVTYPPPTVSDNCGFGTPVCSPPSGSTFPRGTTTVTCTVSDASGNPASCTFTVTVNDDQPPTITCPDNITTTAPPGQCSAAVTFPNPTTTDNCPGVTTSCLPPSGASFQVGPTTVTCRATDASGDLASCSFTVTVNASGSNIVILQDDNNGNCLRLDLCLRTYKWKTPGGTIYTGPLSFTESFLGLNFQSGPGDRNLLAGATRGLTGTARLSVPGTTLTTFAITDSDVSNNGPCP